MALGSSKCGASAHGLHSTWTPSHGSASINAAPSMGQGPHSAVCNVQARLQRVWHILELPTRSQLRMAKKWSSPGHPACFVDAISSWEMAVAGLLDRERALGRLLRARYALRIVPPPLPPRVAALASLVPSRPPCDSGNVSLFLADACVCGP